MLMFLCCVFFSAIGQGNLSLLWRSRLLASPRLWKESPLLWKESFKGEGIDIDRLVRFDSPQLRAKVSGPHCLILGPWLRPGEANRDTVFASPTVSLASPFGPGSTRQCGGNGGGAGKLTFGSAPAHANQHPCPAYPRRCHAARACSSFGTSELSGAHLSSEAFRGDFVEGKTGGSRSSFGHWGQLPFLLFNQSK